MPALTTIIAVGGLVASAVGAYGQMQASSKAAAASGRQAEAQQAQARLEQQRADIQNTRTLRASIRQSRIAAASITNAGANAGTGFSSGVMGGVASVGSQEGANVSFFNKMGELNSEVTDTQIQQGQAMADQGSAQGESATYGAFGKLGGTVFSEAGGFKTIFSAGK